jgi:hypothetical protein
LHAGQETGGAGRRAGDETWRFLRRYRLP